MLWRRPYSFPYLMDGGVHNLFPRLDRFTAKKAGLSVYKFRLWRKEWGGAPGNFFIKHDRWQGTSSSIFRFSLICLLPLPKEYHAVGHHGLESSVGYHADKHRRVAPRSIALYASLKTINPRHCCSRGPLGT